MRKVQNSYMVFRNMLEFSDSYTPGFTYEMMIRL